MRLFNLTTPQQRSFADAMAQITPSFTEVARGLQRIADSMSVFGDRLTRAILADIATLNDTQRAIYFAHRRAGLPHYDILSLL